jgi:hypothetical protein
MKMIPVLIILPLLATASWAYAPDCNVTRGIYVHARHLMPTEVWAKWGSGYEIVKEQPHSGECCLKAVNEPGDAGQGAGQSVELNQKKAEPLKISGWSRAEGVAGEKGYEYSIYVDLQFMDGEGWPMKIAAFETGTHDWEYSELIIEPEKPLRSARYWAFLRDSEGTVWFDDLFFGPPDGENLLQSPGFEKDLDPDTSVRDEIFDTYEQLHANAIHTYTRLPADEDAEKNLRGMLEAAKARGMGVVVTPHVYTAPVQSADDPDFPQWNCVLGDWGDRWVEALGGYAQYDFMGISLVPDEYNWTTGRFKRAFAKHKDDTVREFYENIPNYCDCPVCHERFQEMYGEPMPEMGKWSRPPEQTDAYRKWIDFRYRATTDWIRRSAEAIKSVNPAIRTDSLICVSPICSDFRLGTGVAWDMMGYGSDIDFPTTDPYILLHNYVGDSTHWYVTETTAHLVGCTPKRQAGIVIESSRLRAEHRPLAPVEIYGSALSAVSRDAKELAWWHYVHISGQSGASQGETSFSSVRGVYDLLERVDPWLTGATALRRVALLYSRASEEYFSSYTHPEPNEILTHATDNLRYPFLAHKEVLYYLFRRGIPTDLYFLDQVSADELADYPTIVVPFPFAVGEQQLDLLTQLAETGKSVVIISEFGTVDELGAPLDAPALLQLCGLAAPPTGEKQGPLTFAADSPVLSGETLDGFTVYESVQPAEGARVLATVDGVPAILERSLGSGRVLFLAGEFGIGLPANYDNEVRGREVRVLPSELSVAHVTVMDALLDELSPGRASLIRQAPEGKDLEVAAMRNAAGDVVLFAINWESDPQSCEVALPEGCAAQGAGFYLDSAGAVSEAQAEARQEAGELRFSLDLEGQEARVLRFAAE